MHIFFNTTVFFLFISDVCLYISLNKKKIIFKFDVQLISCLHTYVVILPTQWSIIIILWNKNNKRKSNTCYSNNKKISCGHISFICICANFDLFYRHTFCVKCGISHNSVWSKQVNISVFIFSSKIYMKTLFKNLLLYFEYKKVLWNLFMTKR